MLRIGMLTSGGDCQALNAAMRGVFKTVTKNSKEPVEFYGFEDGYKGLIYSKFRILTESDFSNILTVGGTMLGTSRCPFKTIREPDEKGLDKVEAMKQTYIEDVIAGEDPEAIEPQVFQGAKTIKVAVTGDRPPMDYVSAGGEPLGFNTALIAEVAKRLEMNIELVNVTCAARGIALATGVCDIVFWMEVGDFENWEGADFEDQPENTVVTEPYMSVPLWWAVLKDSPVVNVYRDK